MKEGLMKKYFVHGKFLIMTLVMMSFYGTKSLAQALGSKVHIVGEMRDVMWKGELFGKINLDTIHNRSNLYGLGPVEYLQGEILIIDGRSYKSTVVSDTEMQVEETFQIKAPFFGYTRVSDWRAVDVPDSIQTMQELEFFIENITLASQEPFFFKLKGVVDMADIHIVNLPEGTQVSSPDEAHKGQINYTLLGEQVDIVGFYSTHHKAIFTHHDTNVHMHLITGDRKRMGHLDKLICNKGSMKLFLPAH
jgi:acetolactate decarboxylase